MIAIDIDEVIGAFLPAIIRWHNATFATPALTLASFLSYRFCEVWGGTNEEATEKVHDFFETPYFLEQLEPIEGAADTAAAHTITCDCMRPQMGTIPQATGIVPPPATSV